MARDFNDTPHDMGEDPSELQQAVLMLLEDYSIDTATNDQIIALIDAAEKRLIAKEAPPVAMIFCGRCNEYEPVANSCARQYGHI